MRGREARGFAVVGVALGLVLWGCGEAGLTSPELASLQPGTPVAISFRAASGSPTIFPGADDGAAAPSVEGALELHGVHLAVDEFKLEGNDEACDPVDPAPDCAKFEVGPHLLALPLAEEDPPMLIRESAPSGSFTSLKFETKAVAGNPDLLADIADEGITDWPSGASLLVTGEFTPDGGVAESFRVYFDAEVKIVLTLPDPLVLTEGDDVEQTISIEVDPELWFRTEGGSHTDLRPLDYEATGEVHKLEVKLEEAFTKIELEG